MQLKKRKEDKAEQGDQIPKFTDLMNNNDFNQSTNSLFYNEDSHSFRHGLSASSSTAAAAAAAALSKKDKELSQRGRMNNSYFLPMGCTCRNFTLTIVLSLVLLGAGAASLFLCIGVRSANKDGSEDFTQLAEEVKHTLEMAFHDYVVAASFVQEASSWNGVEHDEFQRLYQNMQHAGLKTRLVSHNLYIQHSERQALEEESRGFYQEQYPDLTYRGIQGLEFQDDDEEMDSMNNTADNTTTTTTTVKNTGSGTIRYRSEQPYYFISHLVEPVYGNENYIDFDWYSIPEMQPHINQTLETREATLSFRIGDDPSSYSVLLLYSETSTLSLHDNHGHWQRREEQQEATQSSMSSIQEEQQANYYNQSGALAGEESNLHSNHGIIEPPSNNNHLSLGNESLSFTSIQIYAWDLFQQLYDLPPHEDVYIYIFCGNGPKSFYGGVYVPRVTTDKFDEHNDGHNEDESSDESDDWHHDETHHEHDNRHEEDGHQHHYNGDDGILRLQPEISEEELLQTISHSQKVMVYKFNPLSRKGHRGRTSKYKDNDSSVDDWSIYVISEPGSYETGTIMIVTAGALLLLLCILLGVFIYANIRRTKKLNRIEEKAHREKAMLVIQNAKKAAKRERDLNDFIAHEVRNPLAAAMSACSFVSSEVLDEKQPLVPPERYQSVKEDIGIIDSSLHFINDLLRNMLDMQRAGTQQLKISNAPTHVMNDILRPVDCMLHRRGADFEVILECDPENLVIMTDSLRLKQIILNLARNAVKFVEKGFIRIKAITVDDRTTAYETTVRLSVEDSGPGIPEEKQKQLFGKFQESLDSLSQGTGIGLSLCKQLTKLMGGMLWIDSEYDSGVPGCPGTKFVIDLNIPPMEWDDSLLEKYENASDGDILTEVSTVEDPNDFKMDSSSSGSASDMISSGRSTKPSTDKLDLESGDSLIPSKPLIAKPEDSQLPENLSVLFVDDDMVLRKLFSRSVRKVAPTWSIQEAGNGETALMITKTESFDIIFMDQYMASVQKQLLGTETTKALRAQGVTSQICGLSANDAEKSFLEAGANAFMMKPFPCKPDALRKELIRVINTSQTVNNNVSESLPSSGVSSVNLWVNNVA